MSVNQELLEDYEFLNRDFKKLKNREYDLEETISCLIHTLEYILHLNSLGKSKEIADEIRPILEDHQK
jgi:hypothetical protein